MKPVESGRRMATMQPPPKPIRNPKRASEQDVVFCPDCGAMLELAKLERTLRSRRQDQRRASENAPEPTVETEPSGDAQASDETRHLDRGKAPESHPAEVIEQMPDTEPKGSSAAGAEMSTLRVGAGVEDSADVEMDSVEAPTRDRDTEPEGLSAAGTEMSTLQVGASAEGRADVEMDDVDEPTRVLDSSEASNLVQATATVDESDYEMLDIDSVLATPYAITEDPSELAGPAGGVSRARTLGMGTSQVATPTVDPAGATSRTTTTGWGAPGVAPPVADPAEATSRTTTLGMGAPVATAPATEPAGGVSRTTTIGMGGPQVESAAMHAVASAGAAGSAGAAAPEAMAAAQQELSDARTVYRPAFSQEALDRALEQDVSARVQFSEAPVARDRTPDPQHKSNRGVVGFGLGAAALGAALGLYSHLQPGEPSIQEAAAGAVRVPAAVAPRELTAFGPALDGKSADEEADPETEPAEEGETPEPAALEVVQAEELARAVPEKAAVPQAVRAAVGTEPSLEPSVARNAPVAAASEVSSVVKAEASSAPEPEATPAAFDSDAAARSLSAAAANASTCRAANGPRGQASVTVTFAPSGRVTAANIAGPLFAGTATGSCIASMMRTAKVPAFKGAHVTVRKRVTIR